MPRLIIDGRSVEVPQGTKVIEAAERLGIMIPRFCYHPALGAVGACRVCAVAFLDGPVRGVQMSCMEDACDGMVVSTTDRRAVDFRRDVIEWLMLHHPHDCPVCDEGGHCLLQDMTVSSGHGLRRYRGPKRTFRDQYLGPLVQHEMNRCIQCYRCRRFYQDFAGYRDLGALQIANRVYFGRAREGRLESPFAGNLIDVCPTGVFTDKPARHRVRNWDLERAPTLCLHCSLGCHAIGNARYRRVWRLEARLSEAVNGHFLCDRGRFGFAYEHAPDRPRRARRSGAEASVAEALGSAAERLETHAPGEVACFASPRASLETLSALAGLCRASGWQPPGFFDTAVQSGTVRAAVASLGERRTSLRELESADFVLAVGVDPLAEAPMLALALRQAVRRGATVAVADPRPVSLPFPFDHLALPPWEFERLLAAFAGGGAGLTGEDPAQRERVETLRRRGREALRPAIVCGTDVPPGSTPAAAARAAATHGKGGGGLFYVLPGANAFGGALASPAAATLSELLDGIEEGRLKALVLVEADPFRTFPDRARLERALGRLEALVVLDYIASATAERAHVFLPTQTLYEAGGIYVNGEGRAQRARPVHRGGLPVLQETGGDHPPRIFRSDLPGGEPRPAWELLALLGGALVPGFDPEAPPLSQWRGASPLPPGLGELDPESEGVLLPLGEGASPERPASAAPKPPAPGELQLYFVEETFGTEELSSYSPPLQELEETPWIALSPADAEGAGLTGGDRVAVAGTDLGAELRVPEGMASGVVLLPRRRGLPWQALGGRSTIALADLKKVL
ncbi:MAG: NADH-quinone oxidoreductase subunit NuoG [Deltaproteobacteria bacterium]|nr:NADH-quinone oxidoreductase subunit NuoG [Deltaproteobacteria bacterium]